MNESLSGRPRKLVVDMVERARTSEIVPVLWAGAITVAIAVPWLVPGFLFGTDWTGPRRFGWPAELSSVAPVGALLALSSAVLSAELATKLLVVGCLFVASLTAYRAVPVGDFIPRATASLIYVLNPFVYGRLHYGQFFLIAAYAVLPWVAMRIYRLVASPSAVQALWLALGVVIVAMFAVHLLLPVVLLLGISVIAAGAYWRSVPQYLARLGRSLSVGAIATLALNMYWLIPYLAGKSYESRVISQVHAGDLAAYSAVPDPSLGLFPNLLGLYGFWAENVQRFPSLKLFVPYWYLVVAALLALAALGAISVFFSRDEVMQGLRWWVVGLLVAGIIGLLLEAGVTDSHVAPLVRWLNTVFPPYRGMRDAGKWAALLAVVYAQLVPLGVIAIREWLQQRHVRPLRDLGGALIAGVALALPLYYGNGLLFGMHREIRPSQYPSGWYAADRVMVADPRHDRALFLPWHQYLRLSFVHNVNSVVATPAPGFFSVPIVASANPEVAGISPPSDPEQRKITSLVESAGTAPWASTLAALNIKYVLVAKEVDSERFAFLAHQSGLVLVSDYGSITLYRNTLLN